VYIREVNTAVEVPELNREHTLDDGKPTAPVVKETVTARSGRRVKLPSKVLC
jgi:hypothetical protein